MPVIISYDSFNLINNFFSSINWVAFDNILSNSKTVSNKPPSILFFIPKQFKDSSNDTDREYERVKPFQNCDIPTEFNREVHPSISCDSRQCGVNQNSDANNRGDNNQMLPESQCLRLGKQFIIFILMLIPFNPRDNIHRHIDNCFKPERSPNAKVVQINHIYQCINYCERKVHSISFRAEENTNYTAQTRNKVNNCQPLRRAFLWQNCIINANSQHNNTHQNFIPFKRHKRLSNFSQTIHFFLSSSFISRILVALIGIVSLLVSTKICFASGNARLKYSLYAGSLENT